MPVESPEMFITVYWVKFLMLLQRQLSNLTKTANTSSLPFRVFRLLKIATNSLIFNNNIE